MVYSPYPRRLESLIGMMNDHRKKTFLKAVRASTSVS